MEAGLRVPDLAHAETLLRVAQEAITNALRHGRPTRIDVRCLHVENVVELRVDNDGAAPATLRPGNGLTGMRERLDALGGTLEVRTTPPRGVQLRARLPVPAG